MKRTSLRRVGKLGYERAKAMRALPCGWHCARCKLLARTEKHHITPRSRGGTDTLDNIAYLCASCHRGVHDHTVNDWRRWLK